MADGIKLQDARLHSTFSINSTNRVELGVFATCQVLDLHKTDHQLDMPVANLKRYDLYHQIFHMISNNKEEIR